MITYTYSTVDELDSYIQSIGDVEIIRTNKRIEYLNVACSFDIETSSIVDYQGYKAAFMYVFMIAVRDRVIIGRTWAEFLEVMRKFSQYWELSDRRRLIIYVHNLAFEFQYMRKWLNWSKVFAIDVRTPAYAVCDYGIEFRCSYLLSGYSLAKLGDTLKSHDVRKTDGLDYSLVRHSETPLTDDELEYCINDVLVVTAYITERMEHDGDITKIPLTKTGYVRQHCKKACLGYGKRNRNVSYYKAMQQLRLDTDTYKQLRRAFQGGFTHANPFYSGKILHDVDSYDFTSAYPYVMVSEKFPMSSPENYTPTDGEDFMRTLSLYCVLIDVYFEGIESKVYFDSYISLSRCKGVVNAVVNNGRIVQADRLYTTITEQDFLIISAMYEWKKLGVRNVRRFKRAYLPTEFVQAILELYANKTLLKGVKGKEYEYLKSKEMINAAYGMIVTDIARDDISYTDDWVSVTPDLFKQIKKYNSSHARFLYYPWGIWVTAYCRRNLFTGILRYSTDYVYSDTDSIKVLHGKNHDDYIKRYNAKVCEKLEHVMRYHDLPYDLVAPKTLQGETKTLGMWEYEGMYTRFKTLGAKRYMTETRDGISLTVSGLNKSIAMPYLQSVYNDPFEAFTDRLYIPKGHTGKLVHTYIDDEQKGEVLDYNGKISQYWEKSSVHLDNADYTLNIGHEYADYIIGLITKEI